MEGQLGQFLKRLATDPKALRAYRLDPDGTMKMANLSEAEVAAMKSKDPSKIAAALGGEEEDALKQGIIVLVL